MPESNTHQCSIEEQRDYTYSLIKGFYLWNRHVPEVNAEEYDSASQLLADLRYKEYDRWSYIADRVEYETLFEEGQYIGLGVRLIQDEQNRVFVSLVHTDSPAYEAGIARGDEILRVNGVTLTEVSSTDWAEVWGDSIAGLELELEWQASDGGVLSAIVSKRTVTIKPVYKTAIVGDGEEKTAYLMFTNFFFNSIPDLDETFEQFAEEKVSNLVLDLRYNSGGSLRVAQHLASLIEGKVADRRPFRLFVKSAYNNAYHSCDNSYKFSSPDRPLSLQQLVVISSPATCSASEAIIKGLEPHIPVTVVGETSCGKPVGFNPRVMCDKIISLVNFELRNSLNQGEYYTGIPADCPAEDDINHPLGNISEAGLSTALSYITSGQCPAGEALAIPRRVSVPAAGGLREISGSY